MKVLNLKFKFLCSKTNFLKKNIQNFCTLKKKHVLGLIAAAATYAAIQRRSFGSGTTTFEFSNEDLNDIMKIVKSVYDIGLLIKGVTKTIQNEVKEKK